MSLPLPRPRARRLALCLLGATAVLPFALLGCNDADGGNDAVVLGLAAPLDEEYGASSRRGVELALKQINERGGIRGRRVELRAENDSATRESAVIVADRLVSDPSVVAVVGHVNSGTMVAASPKYDQGGLAALATSATSPLISGLGPWVFRVASSDSLNAVALARHARGLGSNIAVLYENDDYGRGLAHSFAAAIRAGGGEVAELDPYLSNVADLTPYLERMRRRGVDVVFIAGLESDAARAIRQAQALGLGAQFIGGDGVEGLVGMGPEYNGTRVGLLFHPDASPAAAEFTAAYRAAYGREPDSFAAAGYDALNLLARAATEGGADREGIREYLEGVGRPGGTPEFVGATGILRFDERGDPVDKAFAVGTIRNGTIVLNGGNQ